VTVPVGTAVPEVSLTAAVNVMAVPVAAVVADAVSVVVVAASAVGVTVTVTADEVEASLLVSPP
jgi:hypothetical protein